MVTLAPSSTPRVGDSAIEKIEVKLTHFIKKKKNNSNHPSIYKNIGTLTECPIKLKFVGKSSTVGRYGHLWTPMGTTCVFQAVDHTKWNTFTNQYNTVVYSITIVTTSCSNKNSFQRNFQKITESDSPVVIWSRYEFTFNDQTSLRIDSLKRLSGGRCFMNESICRLNWAKSCQLLSPAD